MVSLQEASSVEYSAEHTVAERKSVETHTEAERTSTTKDTNTAGKLWTDKRNDAAAAVSRKKNITSSERIIFIQKQL